MSPYFENQNWNWNKDFVFEELDSWFHFCVELELELKSTVSEVDLAKFGY
jgi:hypothetical protein